MAAPNSITVKVLDIVTESMQEMGALAAGETAPYSGCRPGRSGRKLQRLIDRYNARKVMVYNVNFATYSLACEHLSDNHSWTRAAQ